MSWRLAQAPAAAETAATMPAGSSPMLPTFIASITARAALVRANALRDADD